MARPMIDVFSIAIYPKSLPCELFGKIAVFDDSDPEKKGYILFERNSQDPEIISEIGHELLLNGPDDAFSMHKPIIVAQLKHTQQGLTVVDGADYLDCTVKDDYEEIKYSEIKGAGGYVMVKYISIAAALGAYVVIYSGERMDKSEEVQKTYIYGTMFAHYGHTSGSGDQFMSTLLNIPPNKAKTFTFSSDDHSYVLKFAKHLVAVPAYSSLIIDVDLKERDTNTVFFHGTFEELAGNKVSSSVHCMPSPTLRHIYSPNASLVTWWRRPAEIQRPPIDLRIARLSLSNNSLSWYATDGLLEVYSVFIGRENDDELSVFGKITVDYLLARSKGDGGFSVIFNRSKKNAEKLLKGRKLLFLTGPSKPQDFLPSVDFFKILVNLKDTSHDRLLIKDRAKTFNTCFSREDELSHDKLLCCVFQGERGYCAVHYTNFETAVRLRVNFAVMCKTTTVDVANVYGRIVCWYDMFDYPLEYHRKYYRRVLFDKSEDNADFLAFNKTDDKHKQNKLTFSTSYVAMPVGYTMFIDADLHANSTSHTGRGPVEHFPTTLQYQLGKSPMTVAGEYFDIVVDVEIIIIPAV